MNLGPTAPPAEPAKPAAAPPEPVVPPPEPKAEPEPKTDPADQTGPPDPETGPPQVEAGKQPDQTGSQPDLSEKSGLEVPDDHVFMIETDPERGEEPWTVEQLKQAAHLTEQAITLKNQGEEAVQQRDRLVHDLIQSPMETLLNIATARTKDPVEARAWLHKQAVALVNETIQMEEMDPGERASMEKDRQIADLQAALGRQETQDAENARNAADHEDFQKRHNAILAAIEATGYEATDSFIEDIANVLDECRLAGHTNITPSVAAKMVLTEYDEKAKTQWDEFDVAKAPPEVIEAFRKFEVERVKADQKPTTSAPSAGEEPKPRRSRRAAGLAI